MFGFDRRKADEAPGHFEQILQEGYTVEEVRRAFETTTTTVHSAAFFVKAMARVRRDMKSGVPSQNRMRSVGAEVTKPAEHPRMLEHPEWLAHPEVVWIRKVCEAMDEQSHRWLSHWQNRAPTAFEIVARRYPQIRDLLRRAG